MLRNTNCTFSPRCKCAEVQLTGLLTAFCPMCLQALSTDSIERLPVYNKTALKNYKVSQKADDWCIPSKEPLDLSNFKMAK